MARSEVEKYKLDLTELEEAKLDRSTLLSIATSFNDLVDYLAEKLKQFDDEISTLLMQSVDQPNPIDQNHD